MIRDVLNDPIINVSAIADAMGISRQTLHQFRRTGMGMGYDAQVKLQNHLFNNLHGLIDTCKIDEATLQKSVDKSKVPDKSKVDKIIEEDGPVLEKLSDEAKEVSAVLDIVSDRVKVTPEEYLKLGVRDRAKYMAVRDRMGATYYKLISEQK